MTELTFDDAVTAGYLPSNQEYGVYYCDGRYANLEAVRARLPHATLYAITVFGRTGLGVFACDCEQGDLTPEQAVVWVEEQIKLDVPLICVYASADTWLGTTNLWGALEKYGPRVKRWVADYNGVRSTVLTYNGRTETFDAHQYNSDPRLDYDVAADGFFTPLPKSVTKKPKPRPKPSYHYDRFAWGFRRLTNGINSPRNVVKNYDRERKNLKPNLERIQTVQANLRDILYLYESGKIKSSHKAWCEGQLRARIGGGEVLPS